MKSLYLPYALSLLSLLVITPKLWAQPTCVEANGLTWCYNDQACGQACEDVCAALGSELIDDDNVWFQAQDTVAECQAISQAFGLGNTVLLASWTFGCLEDSFGIHTVGGGLNAPLLCSTFSGCPAQHRTSMDGQASLVGLAPRARSAHANYRYNKQSIYLHYQRQMTS